MYCNFNQRISSSVWDTEGHKSLNDFMLYYIPRIMLSARAPFHYSDVIMNAMAFQITGVSIACSTIYSGRSKKTSKLRVTGLCEENSPVNGEFPSQRASNAENVSIWWRYRVNIKTIFPGMDISIVNCLHNLHNKDVYTGKTTSVYWAPYPHPHLWLPQCPLKQSRRMWLINHMNPLVIVDI